MALQLIPIAVGTAVGATAAYVITDRRFRSRIADGPAQLARAVSAYFTGSSASVQQTETSAPASKRQQPQPVRRPHRGFTDLSASDEPPAADRSHPVQQPPDPTQQPDEHRCQAMTKAGNRCRSRTHAVVSMPRDSGEAAKVGLCSVHSGMHEKGGTVTLVDGS